MTVRRLLVVACFLLGVVAGCGEDEYRVPMAGDKRGDVAPKGSCPELPDSSASACAYSEFESDPAEGEDLSEQDELDLSNDPEESFDEPVGAAPPPLPPAVNGVRVLYDDTWLVEEGQWWLGSGETYMLGDGGEPSFQRLLESAGTEAVVITVPGLYGRYRTKVELHDVKPAVPGWCEDVAEASFHVSGTPSGVQMGSFETFSDPYGFSEGWFRVRYCTEKQDTAARQDEFTGEEYTVYAGRHLLQLWSAPRAPDRILRQDSRWARSLTKN